MSFIDQQQILDATNGGRDVIELYFPESSDSFNNTRKKFKTRPMEKTASASLKKLQDGTWLITDFGGDQKPRNAIQMVQQEENCDFKTALALIAAKFNISSDELKNEIYKPIITKSAAQPDQPDGTWYFKTKDFTLQEITSLLAPKVWEYLLRLAPSDSAEKSTAVMEEVISIFKRYHFYSLESYTIIKNREAITIGSTEHFPIYMFDEKDFKKLYKPKEIEASKRFMHYMGRPADFVFGYSQAKKAYDQIIKIGDDDEIEDEPETKKKKPAKIKQLCITSGGSDGLNVAVMGQAFKGNNPEQLAEQLFPVWFNSETAKPSQGTFKNLFSIAENVYNIPDIDHTGKVKAHEMALDQLDLCTLYLPDELLDKKDAFRNKPCKDLRDYLRFWSPWDFFKLFKTAYPYRFWDMAPQFNKKGDFTKFGFQVNLKHMLNFLRRCGFYRYAADSEKDLYFYIKIQDNIVSRVDPRQIRDFINQFIEHRNPDVELMNTFLRTTQLNENSLSNLPFITIDFTDFDDSSQWMFFKNRSFKITSDEIKDFRAGTADKFVWDDEVIDHRITKMDDFFSITGPGLSDPSDQAPAAENWDIEIKNDKCLVFRYLMNCSRIHWREELERRLDGIPLDERESYAQAFNLQKNEMHLMDGLKKEEAAEYRIKYKHAIDGPLLTAQEKAEHKLHLINKIYSLGYIFHRYKEPSKAWAIWSMDAKISEGDESHGGSGKSLVPMLIYAHKIMKTEYRSGRNTKLTDNPHIYENITQHTDLLIIDDCHRYMKFDFFFGDITGPMQVNPKNAKQYTIPFSSSPKICFSSNYPPHQIDPSKERRILYQLYSDYYHYNKMGEYREERTVADDFGKNLGSDFTAEEWDLFMNFIMQCIRFFISTRSKINPPMGNVNKRNLKALMGDAFEPWSDVYFSEESGRLNMLIVKTDALNDFLRSSKSTWTVQKFSHALHAWCSYNGYELNPDEFKNSAGRIIRKVDVTDGFSTVKKSAEMIYVRTPDALKIAPTIDKLITGKNPDDITPY